MPGRTASAASAGTGVTPSPAATYPCRAVHSATTCAMRGRNPCRSAASRSVPSDRRLPDTQSSSASRGSRTRLVRPDAPAEVEVVAAVGAPATG